MKIKCTVCNKEFYYGDHNSPMFIDEVWNKIINYFKLTNFEKEAAKKFSSYYKGGGDGAILFDYKEIISLYTSGMTMIEVSAKMQCSVDTVSKVINIPKNKFYLGSCKQPVSISQYDLNNNFIRTWNSIADAAHWLVDNGYAKTYNGGVR